MGTEEGADGAPESGAGLWDEDVAAGTDPGFEPGDDADVDAGVDAWGAGGGAVVLVTASPGFGSAACAAREGEDGTDVTDGAVC